MLPPPFAWCAIPAGTVTLEHGGTFEVAAFDMARYPLTNAQFQVFIAHADGYSNVAWWDFSRKGQRWRAQHDLWESPFPAPDLPRILVSWYEALAFCRWLSAQTGESITLPTEFEWQRAAQGDDGRTFPWGETYAVDYANASESGIKQPTPVTQFPQGASPFGVLDMSGNVQEWCLNSYLIPEDVDILTFEGGDARASRGGSWGLSSLSAQAAFRGYNHPSDRFEFQGFRIARHSV
jgi:formylglycine-generating enzyme required for sulfatase activity